MAAPTVSAKAGLASLLTILALTAMASSISLYPPVLREPAGLRAIPRGTLVAVHIDVAGLMATDLAKGVTPLVADRYNSRLGVPLEHLQSVAYFGFPEEGVILVSTRQPLDRKQVLETLVPGAVELTYKDKTFHAKHFYRGSADRKLDNVPLEPARKAGTDPNQAAVCFIGSRSFIAGTARAVLHWLLTSEAIGEQHPLAPALATMGKQHLTIGFTSLPESQWQLWKLKDAPERFAWWDLSERGHEALLQTIKPLLGARQGLLTANLGGQSRLDLSMDYPTARSARSGFESIPVALLMAKGALLMVEEQMPEPLVPLKADSAIGAFLDLLRTGLERADVKTDGTAVTVTVRANTSHASVKAVLAESAVSLQLLADRKAAQANLRRIALAVIEYAKNNGGFMPPSIVYSKDGKPLHSWRVLILPYLGHKDLFEKVKLHEPWDSPHNKLLLARMPDVFAMPGVEMPEGKTFFQVFEGVGTLWSRKDRVRYPEPADGTLLAVEAETAIHWAAPGDIPYSDRVSPLEQIGRHLGKVTLCVLANGAVLMIPAKVSEQLLRNAIGAANTLPL